MRIYVPLQPVDADALRSGSSRLELATGRVVWGVAPAARRDRPDADAEELEYDAIQDATYQGIEDAVAAGSGEQAVLVIAGDAPDGGLEDASGTAGAFGLRAREPLPVRVASVHVTALSALSARADDTDPALLWFDAAEAATAVESLRR